MKITDDGRQRGKLVRNKVKFWGSVGKILADPVKVLDGNGESLGTDQHKVGLYLKINDCIFTVVLLKEGTKLIYKPHI